MSAVPPELPPPPRVDLMASPETIPLEQATGATAAASHQSLNTLAVAALILAMVLSPLAALFGHVAASQIARSNGRERGAVMAWVAVGLGYLWLVGAVVVGVVVWQVLNG